MKKALPWVLALVPAAVFLMTLPAKFTGAAETQHIFGTVGDWFASIGIAPLDRFFDYYGAYVIGSVELVAALLLIAPPTRLVGAVIGLAVLSGALFFHVFTPLGVAIEFPGSADGDPSLFVMTVISWLCCAATAYLNRPARDA